MARITTNINNFDDNWIDVQCGGIKNIRVIGSYPNVKHKKHVHSHYHPGSTRFLMNQHKPYGIATVGLLNPFDDRPDWFMFHSKHRKRKYEEIIPSDKEFYNAMEQDHEMHIPHNHLHIKEVEQGPSPSDEIEDTIII